MAPEITLARSNTENMAAALISDRAPDAFREKSKLLLPCLPADQFAIGGRPSIAFPLLIECPLRTVCQL
jgi:hypothetical protein